jgi:hypothetical protein
LKTGVVILDRPHGCLTLRKKKKILAGWGRFGLTSPAKKSVRFVLFAEDKWNYGSRLGPKIEINKVLRGEKYDHIKHEGLKSKTKPTFVSPIKSKLYSSRVRVYLSLGVPYKMSKKNDLARRKRQHEFELKRKFSFPFSQSLHLYIFLLLIDSFFLVILGEKELKEKQKKKLQAKKNKMKVSLFLFCLCNFFAYN